jgi:segregation and condensation protein A
MYKIKIEKFAGPLDLLLQLIEGKELEITEISLAEVTDQYLERTEKMKDKPAEELADFLVIAAKLLLLKSKAILPMAEEEVEPDELEKQLKIYKEYYEASKVMDKMLKKENFSYSREKPPIKTEVEFVPPKNVNRTVLKNAFLHLLKKLDPLMKLPKVAIEKTISLQEKIVSLSKAIKKFRTFDFSKLVKDAKSKTEVIVNFLALLELIKQENVHAQQEDLFGNIMVKKA